ncbi:GNAT family N-acetyltransferase [Sphingobium lignivorans]|uniref:N-acetyltransferase YhbS n=1 Tax=Sphingobium lignivorans TaxID=2735886 RepID=A0ABR6N9Y2_9SPHN|nr:putative N-acetyltransferase YhbS [Sphingobium lignivorans]
MTRIRELAGAGDAAITRLLDEAFGPNRHGRTAYRIRLGMAWFTDLSFAAYDSDDRLIGTLQSWPVALHGPQGGPAPLVMVGPVAVVPDQQRHGIGRALMDRLIETVDAHGADPLVMIGDPEYYGRFWGFSADATGQWDVPGPVERHRLLVRAPADAVLPAIGMLGPRTALPQPSLQATVTP